LNSRQKSRPWRDFFVPDGRLKQKHHGRQEDLRLRLQIDHTGSSETHAMKKTIAILAATTALAAAIGLSAWSAVSAEPDAEARPIAAAFADGQEAFPLVLVSDDDDGEESDDDDKDDDKDDEDDERPKRSGDDDDDDDGAGRGAVNPAPAGSVTPPQNGLFGNGAAPQVQVN
jgi:hypothetical protein